MMIKVIASDMDGTLLNDKHKLSKETVEAIKRAQQQGIRFMISTGRKYKDAIYSIENEISNCDFITINGAEIRGNDGKIVKQIPMETSELLTLWQRLSQYSIAVSFYSDEQEYVIGKQQEIKNSLIAQTKLFFQSENMEQILNGPIFKKLTSGLKCVKDIDELIEMNIPIYKIFIFSFNKKLLVEIDHSIANLPTIASASSFEYNLELTNIKAQKGLAIKDYIQQLGYTMEEVMVIGDSMNDYSMLSQDFGATVAMGNAMEEIKKVSKYITKTNEDNGVAYCINQLLEGNLEKLRNQ
jgi:Cof subfamily protein (haloacid dehalogenase superfamily)